MDPSWAFVVLLVYPALQLPMLWVVVRYFGLRNDDGPRDPRGYSLQPREEGTGDAGPECHRCGNPVDPTATYCGQCLAAQH